MKFIDELMGSSKAHILEELSLAVNNIGDQGAEKIGAFLDFENCKLKVLNLHWNKIGVKGGIKIGEAMEHNSYLKILDVSWNKIGKYRQSFYA